MSIIIRDFANTPRVITGVKIRNASNTLSAITSISVRGTSALRLVFTAFGGGSGQGVSVSPTYVYGYGNSKGVVAISTDFVTVTATGGTPPYTYLWTGPGGVWSATSPISEVTSFRRTSVPAGSEFTADFTCTVTDANGHTATTQAVTADVTNTYQF